MELKETKCPVCNSHHFRNKVSSKVQMHKANKEFIFVECAECSLVYLNPVVPTEQLGAFYDDYYLPYRGARAWGKWASLARKGEMDLDKTRAELVQKLTPLDKSKKVLDVGCGRPSFLNKLSMETACQAFGLDFKVTGWKNEKEFERIELIEGEVKDLPESATFDLITMWHYLEHDYDPVATLKRLKKLSHKDTFLVIEVPDYDSISRRYQGSQWAGFHTPRHISIFKRKTLRNTLQKSGWKEFKYFKNGTLNPYVLWWLGKMEQKGIDWSKSLEPHFLTFLAGHILSTPLAGMMKPFFHLGIQLAVFKPE